MEFRRLPDRGTIIRSARGTGNRRVDRKTFFPVIPIVLPSSVTYVPFHFRGRRMVFPSAELSVGRLPFLHRSPGDFHPRRGQKERNRTSASTGILLSFYGSQEKKERKRKKNRFFPEQRPSILVEQWGSTCSSFLACSGEIRGRGKKTDGKTHYLAGASVRLDSTSNSGNRIKPALECRTE